jgi:hypothetical protein
LEYNMTQLQVVAIALVPQQPSRLVPIQLKCPACRAEFARPVSTKFDARTACPDCTETSEVRQFHEFWCVSRRAALALRFPGLLVIGDEALAPLCSADAKEGERRAQVPQVIDCTGLEVVGARRPARKDRRAH